MDHTIEYLTEAQKIWFGDRMTENASGRVIIPTHLCEKFKKIADNPFMDNSEIRCWLIDHCY